MENVKAINPQVEMPENHDTAPVPPVMPDPHMREMTDEERRNLEALKMDVSEALAGVCPGWQIGIYRSKPDWCATWIETVPCEMDDNGRATIDLQWLKETYGGDTLKLRFIDEHGKYLFQKTVRFKGVPPREHGRDLEPPSIKELRERQELARLAAAMPQPQQQQDTAKILELMMKQQERALQVQMEMQTALLQRTIPPAPDPLQNFNTMFTMFAEFERMKRTFAPPVQEKASSDDIPSLISSVIDLMKHKGNEPQQTIAGPVSAPRPMRMPGVFPAPIPAAVPAPVPAPVQNADSGPVGESDNAIAEDDNREYDQESEVTLAEELAEMDPADLAMVVSEVLGSMPEEKAKAVFEAFNRIGQGVPGK